MVDLVAPSIAGFVPLVFQKGALQGRLMSLKRKQENPPPTGEEIDAITAEILRWIVHKSITEQRRSIEKGNAGLMRWFNAFTLVLLLVFLCTMAIAFLKS